MVNPPVYHGSTVVYQSLDALEYARAHHDDKDALVYGRLGSESTFAFENAIADLENAFGALSTSSGLAAVTTAILAVVKAGDHLLVADTVYAPTRGFCNQFLCDIGVEVEYYDPMIGAAIETLVRANTALIFMESPGSITFEVQDVPAIVAVAKQRDIVTVLDNSWATPLLFRPLDYGVNISVIAATKYIVGHADALIGMIATDEQSFYRVKQCRDYLGHSLAADDVYLGMRGLRTLAVRLRQHEQHALTLATWLKQQDGVLQVLHPAFEDCPGHTFWKRDFDGSSGLFSFILRPHCRNALANMLDQMQLFSMGFSWGGYESLIVPQDPSRYRSATAWRQNGQVIRLHAGLEAIDDLIADLDKGIKRYIATAPE